MYHEQLVKHNNLNTKMNLHNDDDNVNDGDIHVINIMLAYNLHAHIMAVLGNTHRCLPSWVTKDSGNVKIRED